MTITTNITADLIVEVYLDGQLVDYPGPWSDLDAAQQWADMITAAIESGEIIYPEQETP